VPEEAAAEVGPLVERFVEVIAPPSVAAG
jgi:hypothetical protein